MDRGDPAPPVPRRGDLHHRPAGRRVLGDVTRPRGHPRPRQLSASRSAIDPPPRVAPSEQGFSRPRPPLGRIRRTPWLRAAKPIDALDIRLLTALSVSWAPA